MIKIDEMLAAVASCRSAEQPILIEPYVDLGTFDGNEFLVFLKPHLVEGVESGSSNVIDVINQQFRVFGVTTHGRVAIGGRQLARSRLIRRHYGSINAASERGAAAFGPEATKELASLRDEFGDFEVLGGHQYLQLKPEIHVRDLSAVFDSGVLHRLAGGAYGVFVDEGRVLLINGFHPEQVATFEGDSSAIFALQCSSNEDWTVMRDRMIGATNPRKARPDSLRSIFLKRADDLGLGDVSPLRNGIHMSAGPLEGSVEVTRYLMGTTSDPEDAAASHGTSLWKRLEAFIGPLEWASLLKNEDVAYDGRLSPSYDVTEGWNSRHLARALHDGDVVPIP